jgi:aspartyl aminopeptidase
VDFQEPIAFIPSLAIHLDREVNQKRSINPQTDILPILGQHIDDWSVRKHLSDKLVASGCRVDEVLDYELAFYDMQRAALIGLNREFIASARLDNLLSCYIGMEALIAADSDVTALMVCNDHEEVGSLSAVGANGPMLTQVLRQIAGSPLDYQRLVDRSMMISCDNAHGIHPNFADRHDDNHGPKLNAGPVIKVNSNQRYATNSVTSAAFRTMALACDVPVQSFVVRSDMGCGSTIGPITAGETGIQTLDVGVPTFGMHSIRELAGTEDLGYLKRVLQHYFEHYDADTIQGINA